MIPLMKYLTLPLALLFLISGMQLRAEELLFREDWKESPAALPLSQEHVSTSGLQLTLHGPGLHGIKKSHHEWIENDPFYVWSGACPGNWAVSLRPEIGLMNLTRGDIRWRSKQSGFRQLRVILKLHDGSWLVSEMFDSESSDWRVFELSLAETRWRRLNISRITEEALSAKADLSRVLEIGFTDLMPGGLSDACSRLDWIEVRGKWVDR